MSRALLLLLLCGFVTSSFGASAREDLNAVAEKYAQLVLALGQHDPDYVDSFYGPAEWKAQAETNKQSLDAIAAEAAQLLQQLKVEGTAAPLVESKNAEMQPGTTAATEEAKSSDGEMLTLRREYLRKQISALTARVRMLKGEKMKFDEESRALYDAVAPTYPDSHFDVIIKQLEKKIPNNGQSGSGASRTGACLWQRYEEWRKPFVIPKEKLDAVFQLAIKECRARTLAHIALPPNESFTRTDEQRHAKTTEKKYEEFLAQRIESQQT
jgi:hypothetical protein